MHPVDKALWYIESHSAADLSLEDIARSACVSKYHLLRAFSAATGLSVMRYLRGRRLSAAAQRLAAGAGEILTVAVESGYGSHEAFTRAFRDQFGVTPESVRNQGHVNNLQLLEAFDRGSEPLCIDPPRYESSGVQLLAGMSQRYDGVGAAAGIPAQWQRLSQYLQGARERLGQAGSGVTYGVCHNTDDEGGMDYLCSVEVSNFSSLPSQFSYLRIPAMKYAVFFHRQHISVIRGTWNSIWNGWLPQSGHEISDAPLIERYDKRFDPHTGSGGVELWIPIN